MQSYLLKGNEKYLKRIAELGHEVTYHKDVLDANHGDFDLAVREFRHWVGEIPTSRLFGFFCVSTRVTPIMSRNGWDSNKDFFRDKRVASQFSNIFDLVVQGKERIKRDYLYVSDAGYGFKVISDIVGNDQVASQDIPLSSIDELIQLVASSSTVVISTHPHRWFDSSIAAEFSKIRFFAIKKVATYAGGSLMLRRIMSKFYYLAKKI